MQHVYTDPNEIVILKILGFYLEIYMNGTWEYLGRARDPQTICSSPYRIYRCKEK